MTLQIVLVEKKVRIKIKVHLYLLLKEQQQKNFIDFNASILYITNFSCKINFRTLFYIFY